MSELARPARRRATRRRRPGRRSSPLASGHPTCPREDVRQLQRARPREAGDAEDLARPGLEVDPAQPLAVRSRAPRASRAGRPGRRRSARKSGSTSSPTISAGERARVEAVDVVGAHPPPAAQDGDPVGELRRSRPSGARRRGRSCPACAPRRRPRRGARPRRGGARPWARRARARRRPPSPAAPRRSRRRSAATGVAAASGPVDVEVDVERREDPTGLGLLLTPQHPAAEAAGEAAVEREVVLGAELEDQAEVLVDEAQAVRHRPGRPRRGRRRARRGRPGRPSGTPASSLISVDLPEPFWPMRACISPRRDVERDVVERPGPGNVFERSSDPQHRPPGGVGRDIGVRAGAGNPPAERRPRPSPSVVR